MSLILEALRKSEAERRRGLAPDLFVELPPLARRRDSALSRTLWLLLALAALAIGAWLTRGQWVPSPRTEAAGATTVPDAAGRQPSREPSAIRPVDSAPRPADDIAASIPAPDAGSPVAVEPTMEPALRSPPPTATAAMQPSVVPPPAPMREPLPAVPNPAPAPAPEPVAPTPASPASGNAAIVQLADLSADQRKQLPPLRMSMHMWDQDPARRFVIIDGARLTEGDRIGDAVIGQITADSVLLDWNGRRLRLTLR